MGELLRRWSEAGRLGTAGQLERLAAQVLADPLVARLREKYPGLDEETLRHNLNRLHQCTREYRNCRECPGLERCPNDLQGHFTRITCAQVGGRWQLFDHKVPCAKWQAHERQRQIRSRITSFYANWEQFGEFDPMDMIRRDKDRQPAVHQVLAYIHRTVEEGLQKKGLYLMGGFGTGKTHLAAYLLYELSKNGYSGVIVYMPEFVEDAKALMLDPQKLKETVGLMKETDLLVFDDIGAENLNPWVRDHVLGAILNARMNRKPTFYTSNHDLDALERHFSFTHKEGEERQKGRRLMDRIRPYVDVVHVRGRNHRGFDEAADGNG
jgi:primosomal protein DnaI